MTLMKNEVAVVLFSGINYFSGQAFEIQKITQAAHRKVSLASGFRLTRLNDD